MEKMKAAHGTVVVQDPHTGQILALAIAPRYNPNDLKHQDPSILKNLAVSDVYEPGSTFKLLTPGDGHHIEGGSPKEALANVALDGFTMIGAYPRGFQWDSATGGEDVGNYERVWSVPRPDRDPVLGNDPSGLQTLWT